MLPRSMILGLSLVVALGGFSPVSALDGDYNGDGTIDLADYAEFPDCMAGPGGGLGTGCAVFDFDTDTDVDALDFAEFQKVFGTTITVVIETVTIGNPGNTGELSGEGAGAYGPDRICGAVDYVYNIGKYEVTAGQYTAFLNAVAATDTYDLYNEQMDVDSGLPYSHYACNIKRNGPSGSYTYSVDPNWANRPVNFVSWGDAARFANWLHNGQPTGAQDLSTTEHGAYFLDGAASDAELSAIDRETDATWVIPSEDEWYKAAYHKNDGVTGNYWDYPTSSDSTPGYVNNSGNLSGTGAPFIEGGVDPGNCATYDGDGGTYGIGPPYYQTQVGEWENSDSPYGTFDQGGNVYEWNESIPWDLRRGLRGGSYKYYGGALHAAYRNYYDPTHEGSCVGFRVSEVP